MTWPKSDSELAVEDPITVAQLLAERGCTPGCLVARTARCACPCAGRLHGLLASAPVPSPGPPPATRATEGET